MQFGHYAMSLQPTGEPFMGGGMHLLPRDFTKLGQLMLDGGTWHGRRILSRDFVACASPPLYEMGGIQYGYLWWVTDLQYIARCARSLRPAAAARS
jgi:CubicO group peptidase (beta-lactamase class C family)